MDDAPINLDAKRTERAQDRLVDAMLDSMGLDAEGLAALVDSAPAEIRDAVLRSLERQEGYRALDQQHAAQDEAEGIPADRCCNMVCPSYQQFERLEEQPDRSLRPVGPRDRCKGGAEEAHGCIFRMVERPPCDPFRRLPSHAEALRMLARAGLLDPDDFGHWNGTDFAQRQATSTLWWAYVRLLIESGKITGADSGEASDAALVTLGFPPHRTPG